MKSLVRLGVAGCSFLVLQSESAHAAVALELIDRGVPLYNGPTQAPGPVPPGVRGAVVRIVSDEPILRVDAATSTGDLFEQKFGFFGGMLHYYVAATTAGPFMPTPGFDPTQNTVPALLNFDSHFLPPPPGAQVSAVPMEYNNRGSGGGIPGFPEEATLTQRMYVGNLASLENVSTAGTLTSAYALDPGSDIRTLDLAYFLMAPPPPGFPPERLIRYRLHVDTSSGSSILSGGLVVPEPGLASILLSAGSTLVAGRRRLR